MCLYFKLFSLLYAGTMITTKRINETVDDCPLAGWKRITCQRKMGKSAGKFDTYFVSPDGKRLRSCPEVMEYLKRNDLDISIDLFRSSTHGGQAFTKVKKRRKVKCRSQIQSRYFNQRATILATDTGNVTGINRKSQVVEKKNVTIHENIQNTARRKQESVSEEEMTDLQPTNDVQTSPYFRRNKISRIYSQTCIHNQEQISTEISESMLARSPIEEQLTEHSESVLTRSPIEEQLTEHSESKLVRSPIEEQLTEHSESMLTRSSIEEQLTEHSESMLAKSPIEEQSTEHSESMLARSPIEEQLTEHSESMLAKSPIEEQLTEHSESMLVRSPIDEQLTEHSESMLARSPIEEQLTKHSESKLARSPIEEKLTELSESTLPSSPNEEQLTEHSESMLARSPIEEQSNELSKSMLGRSPIEEQLTEHSESMLARSSFEEQLMEHSESMLARSPIQEQLPTNFNSLPPGLQKFYKINYKPPKSPFKLIQEELYHDPWKLLVATIFLNKTGGRHAIPVLWTFFERFPDAEATSKADPIEIEGIIQSLGLFRKRAQILIRFSAEYREKLWHHPSELYGIGKYGNDSFRIFCLGECEDVLPDDHKLNLYHGWFREREDECTDT